MFARLDDLGWEERDARDTYELHFEREAFVAYLRKFRAETVQAIKYEHSSMNEALGGDPDHLFVGCTVEETIQTTRAGIDKDLEALHAIDAILARLGEHPTRGEANAPDNH